MNKGKLLPPVYLVIALVLALAFDYYAPVARVVPAPWNWAGVALVAAGLALIVSQAIVFKSKGTAIKPFDESSVLIQDGLYRFSRNPIYVGMVTLLLGVAIGLGTVTPFIAPIGMWIILSALFIRVEERMLEEKFGDRYRAYQRKVRRWL